MQRRLPEPEIHHGIARAYARQAATPHRRSSFRAPRRRSGTDVRAGQALGGVPSRVRLSPEFHHDDVPWQECPRSTPTSLPTGSSSSATRTASSSPAATSCTCSTSCRQRLTCVATVHEVAAGIAAEYFNAVEGRGAGVRARHRWAGADEHRHGARRAPSWRAASCSCSAGRSRRRTSPRGGVRQRGIQEVDGIARRRAGVRARRSASSSPEPRDVVERARPARHDAPQGPGLPRDLPRRPGRARSSEPSSRARGPVAQPAPAHRDRGRGRAGRARCSTAPSGRSC